MIAKAALKLKAEFIGLNIRVGIFVIFMIVVSIVRSFLIAVNALYYLVNTMN
jgi:hypothetical protein